MLSGPFRTVYINLSWNLPVKVGGIILPALLASGILYYEALRVANVFWILWKNLLTGLTQSQITKYKGLFRVDIGAMRIGVDAREILRNHKNEAISKWVDAVFATYPLETTGFLRTKNDPFTNPVANMTRQAAVAIYDALAGEEVDETEVKAAVERFVKLRAVQKFNPGESLAVFYLMKPVLREVLLEEMVDANLLDEYLAIESRLDTIALLAFDIYAKARDTLAESRIKEIKSQHSQLAKWAQRLEQGKPEQE